MGKDERVFSSLNGIQSPKRNNLSIDTFSKLAQLWSSYVEEEKERNGAKATAKHGHVDGSLERSEELE